MFLSPGLTFAASTGVVGSAMAAGAMAGFSISAIPAVLGGGGSPSVMLKQWWIIYNNGKAVPAVALLSALSYSSVSYSQYAKASPHWRGFALAGLLTVAAIPFTMAVLLPVNNELSAAAHSQTKTMSEDRVRGLVTKWSYLNVARLTLPLSGAIVGLLTLLA
ncbi:hypothetical protein PFICI_06216 [Pestalotiopsis fici W106-1]|uniref:Noranthrone monooxygenase n=1 Tax=Pestalotiopsis fici (strain W106-1 / CGMCC3.15140) TaxID=1229662 RepID=W3X5D3_PESFW|nr:uncharacterized protein PFICI_06216 [Pestalotiopsis fici W106-1]ETS81214.1 hypothetical protein PFICI_06216 [Pestalotiopsis fici W106-1]